MCTELQGYVGLGLAVRDPKRLFLGLPMGPYRVSLRGLTKPHITTDGSKQTAFCRQTQRGVVGHLVSAVRRLRVSGPRGLGIQARCIA